MKQTSKPEMSEELKTVFWLCDKTDCKKENYRIIPVGYTIYTDRCDHCLGRIHEPIVNCIKSNEY
jgi:hypothetical protein